MITMFQKLVKRWGVSIELAFVKTNLMEILDLKNTITETKKSEDRLNSGLDTAKEISEIKNRPVENIPIEEESA